ncbi:GNAT family N-acetyltransferase [Thaumasiovibrio sp. DFM-14]|uniref:GNAT family N-acetyltransferase n=1 Tax=Thaumasiovibrio sp. DFM-14 TaxID=3384792 RepID=UPI0039A36A72
MNVSLYSPSSATSPALIKMVEAFFMHEVLPYDAAKTQKALEVLLDSPALGKVWLINVIDEHNNTHTVGHLVVSISFSLETASRIAVVDQFYLDPEWRSKGVGTFVVPAVEKALANEGVGQISMEVNIGNAGAKRFYERMGYTPRRQHYIMTKPLVVEIPDAIEMVS